MSPKHLVAAGLVCVTALAGALLLYIIDAADVRTSEPASTVGDSPAPVATADQSSPQQERVPLTPEPSTDSGDPSGPSGGVGESATEPPRSVTGILLRMKQDGADIPDDYLSIRRDAAIWQSIVDMHGALREAMRPLQGKKTDLLESLAEQKFDSGTFEYHTFDIAARRAGNQEPWEAERKDAHVIQRIGYDGTRRVGFAKLAVIAPGESTELDAIVQEQEMLRVRFRRTVEQLLRQ